jgi:hypothetical protein
MTRAELARYVGADPHDAHLIRARVANISRHPARRAELAELLGLSRSALPVAVLRVAVSILAPTHRRTMA